MATEWIIPLVKSKNSKQRKLKRARAYVLYYMIWVRVVDTVKWI